MLDFLATVLAKAAVMMLEKLTMYLVRTLLVGMFGRQVSMVAA
jgi:hypothetical protein